MSGFRERLRAFERRLQLSMKDVKCPTHLCLGQEAVPVALNENLRQGDWVFSTHRAHGHYLASGGSEEKLWDEIMGRESGLNGGFSGSQSFSDPAVNFHCSAIVGGLVGVAAGTAYALKLNGSKSIVVSCVGDAGTEQGVYWETLNWSVLHGLPIAFICENNMMSVDARIWERQATAIGPRVKAFGVECVGSVAEAMERARRGMPAFYEQLCKLECDHLNMSSMLPSRIVS